MAPGLLGRCPRHPCTLTCPDVTLHVCRHWSCARLRRPLACTLGHPGVTRPRRPHCQLTTRAGRRPRPSLQPGAAQAGHKARRGGMVEPGPRLALACPAVLGTPAEAFPWHCPGLGEPQRLCCVWVPLAPAQVLLCSLGNVGLRPVLRTVRSRPLSPWGRALPTHWPLHCQEPCGRTCVTAALAAAAAGASALRQGPHAFPLRDGPRVSSPSQRVQARLWACPPSCFRNLEGTPLRAGGCSWPGASWSTARCCAGGLGLPGCPWDSDDVTSCGPGCPTLEGSWDPVASLPTLLCLL